MPKKPLADREYWTPPQTVRILGRSESFWKALVDSGAVAGYPQVTPGGRTYRWIHAQSARNYLQSLGNRQIVQRQVDNRSANTAACRFARMINGKED